jgi:hypothetical protein
VVTILVGQYPCATLKEVFWQQSDCKGRVTLSHHLLLPEVFLSA